MLTMMKMLVHTMLLLGACKASQALTKGDLVKVNESGGNSYLGLLLSTEPDEDDRQYVMKLENRELSRTARQYGRIDHFSTCVDPPQWFSEHNFPQREADEYARCTNLVDKKHITSLVDYFSAALGQPDSSKKRETSETAALQEVEELKRKMQVLQGENANVEELKSKMKALQDENATLREDPAKHAVKTEQGKLFTWCKKADKLTDADCVAAKYFQMHDVVLIEKTNGEKKFGTVTKPVGNGMFSGTTITCKLTSPEPGHNRHFDLAMCLERDIVSITLVGRVQDGKAVLCYIPGDLESLGFTMPLGPNGFGQTSRRLLTLQDRLQGL